MLQRLSAGLLLMAFAAAPAVLLIALRSGTGDGIDSVSSAAVPALQPATARTITDERRVTGTLEWREGRSLRAPGWQGLVTSVRVAPGQSLSTGDVVAVVGGVPRIAVASTQPFHRPLRQDDRGPDVEALNDALPAWATSARRLPSQTATSSRRRRPSVPWRRRWGSPRPPAPSTRRGSPGSPSNRSKSAN